MRYISVLFFIFLFLYSFSVFAQNPQPICTGLVGSPNICGFDPQVGASLLSERMASCTNAGNKLINSGVCAENTKGRGTPTFNCFLECTCPPPSVLGVVQTPYGPAMECVESEPIPEENCPSGYPPVNGQCPVCINGQNPDGTCQDEATSSAQNSSTASQQNSIPTSTPASTPNTSAPTASAPSTGGGGDGGGDGGGGGGGGDGGSGGASGSASNTSSGSNSSWTPHSGYGNWIPVDENSNCPNKYRDNSGQWWCAGSTQTTSAAGVCDPTATNYAACINSGSAGSAASSGAASSDNTETMLADKADQLSQSLKDDIDSELDDFEKAYTDDITDFTNNGVPFDSEPNAIKSVLISFLPVSTSCDPPEIKFYEKTYTLSCDYFNIFKQALGWFLSILTAFQIWQMAIRPVER